MNEDTQDMTCTLGCWRAQAVASRLGILFIGARSVIVDFVDPCARRVLSEGRGVCDARRGACEIERAWRPSRPTRARLRLCVDENSDLSAQETANWP